MPSFIALARDRSAFAATALALAFATGPAGLVSVAAADGASSNPTVAVVSANAPEPTPTPAPPTSEPTPAPAAPAPPTPAPTTPAPAQTPAVDPSAAADDFGPVRASAVVLPGPNLVPIAERIAPVKPPGPSLRFVSAGHRLLAARLKSMNVKVDVAGAASLRAWVILPSQAVKASGVDGSRGDRTLARIAKKQPASGRTTLKLQFDGPAQEALLRFLKVTVIVRLSATDAKGNTRTVEGFVELSDLQG